MAHSAERIVLLGKPGSGKGTQAALLSEALGLPHLSSGEILRSEIRDGTEFGRAVEQYVLKGEIGPEELITTAILEYLGRTGSGDRYILDGFPRTIYQARALADSHPPDAAILLSVPDREIVRRISRRLTCGGCGMVARIDHDPGGEMRRCDACGGSLARRPDDHPEAVEKRLEIFRAEVGPVIEFYRNSGLLVELAGTGSVDEIHAAIALAIRGGA